MTNQQAPEQPAAVDGDLVRAADYLIDRYRAVARGESVRDLDEAIIAYEGAKARLSPPQGTEQGDQFPDVRNMIPSPAAGVGREDLILAISDPGKLAGYRGFRSMAEWTADAILALLHPTEGSVG